MREKINRTTPPLTLSAVFLLTPLLLFTPSHDQFELCKLTFVALTALPLLIWVFLSKTNALPGKMTIFVLIFIVSQTVACIPAISLSWQTSLVGDYENFAGLYTLLIYLAWYIIFTQVLDTRLIRRVFYFVVLGAFLSSLHAIAQHFKFDFVQWDPHSVNATREFAALGNPNFLSAYIAMSLPLFLTLCFEKKPDDREQGPALTIPNLILLFISIGLLFLATIKGDSSLHLTPSNEFNFITRVLGLFLLSLFCIQTSRFHSWAFRLIVGTVLFLGLFSTGSRGGFLAAFLGLALWLWLALRDPDTRERSIQAWKTLPKLPLATFCLGIGLFLLMFGWPFLQRLGNSILHIPQSLAESRLHIWRPAIAIIQANPFWGVGLDTFKIAFPHYCGIDFNQIDGLFTSSRMAHNELLQIAATSGLVGLTAYIALLIVFLRLWIGSYRRSGEKTRWVLIALLASAFAYQVQDLFSFGVVSLNLIWFFSLAAIGHFEKKGPEEVRPPIAFEVIYRSILVLLIMFIVLLPLRRLAADIAFAKSDDFSSALKARNSQTSAEAIDYYSSNQIHYTQRALSLFPWDVKYILYSGLAYEERVQAIPSQAADGLDNALDYYQKAVQMSPANAYYYNDEGRIYSAMAAADPHYWSRSETAYKRSVYFSPSSPFFLLNWVSALEKTGQTEAARQETQRAFELDPTFSAKILAQMAFDEYRAGDKKGAFDHIAEAIQGNTLSAEAYYCRGLLYLSEDLRKKALTDFERVESLHPDPYKDPSIQDLDRFIAECRK